MGGWPRDPGALPSTLNQALPGRAETPGTNPSAQRGRHRRSNRYRSRLPSRGWGGPRAGRRQNRRYGADMFVVTTERFEELVADALDSLPT